MGTNLTRQILEAHLVSGSLVPGDEIAVRVDQTLLQDATGTLAMLEFESLGLPRVRVGLAVQYVDHNLLQADFKNADDHRFLQTASARFGIHFSQPGNGVSHQVHMERFGVPGQVLLGADSHTTGGAGLSMLAIGAGGLDVALAMAGEPYRLPCPVVRGIRLVGRLPAWVSPRDVILELLRRYGVKGGVGRVIEYFGPGVETLSAGDRLIIGNMGAELGATTSVFPSDERTREYLVAVGRPEAFSPLSADEDATYDEIDEVDLSTIEPLIALPSSPGNVVPVRQVAGTRVHQVIVGSSANSSFEALMVVAELLRGRTVHPGVSFHVNPASRQVLENVAALGGLLSLLQAGARIHEPGCQGCIGMGQAPGTGQVSLRTFPRNFPGRSGTAGDRVYLCSSETAVAAALNGAIVDPRDLAPDLAHPCVRQPERFIVDDASIVYPSDALRETEVVRGPNIRPLPTLDPLPDGFEAKVGLRVGDDVSTDEIMPAGAEVLPLRSNIPAMSEHVFARLDPEFHRLAREGGWWVVVGGENYGQGSSREHAALAPRHLGVRVVLAKSFARIHKANLCNFGIVPLLFLDPADYGHLPKGTSIRLPDLRTRIERGDTEIPLEVEGGTVKTCLEVSPRQREMLLAGSEIARVRRSLGTN